MHAMWLKSDIKMEAKVTWHDYKKQASGSSERV
jgi:hypothetical protein